MKQDAKPAADLRQTKDLAEKKPMWENNGQFVRKVTL